MESDVPTAMALNASNGSYEDLVRLNDQRAITLIPAMVLFFVVMLMGLVGNSLVCYIIGVRFPATNQNFLIVWLALFDLLNCLVAIPTDIVDMRFSYMFPSVQACKVLRVIMAFTSIGGAFILLVIAADRYRKICKPLRGQMSRLQVKMALVGSMAIAAFYSWPALIIFGFRTYESPIKGQTAQDCSTSDTIEDTNFPLIYTGILFLTFVIMCTVLITLYCLIMCSIKRHGEYMRKVSVTSLVPMSQIKRKRDAGEASAALRKKANHTIGNEGHFEASSNELDKKSCQLKHQTSEPYLSKETEWNENEDKTRDFILNSIETDETSKTFCMTGEGASQPRNSSEHSMSMTDVSEASMSDSSAKIPGDSLDSVAERRQKAKCKVAFIPISPDKTLVDKPNHKTSMVEDKRDNHRSRRNSPTNHKELDASIPKLERKMTMIAFSVTMVFILSFLPYLSLQIAKTLKRGFDYNLQGTSFLLQNVFLRSYYINSISNPIIYGSLNPRFRREVKSLVRKYTCCRQS